LGVIDSLSAGYRFLARHLELILLPVLLDLFLWLAPRLSAVGLFDQVAQFYTQAATMAELTSDMSNLSRQVAETLRAAGENSNLLTVLLWSSGSLLHLPSLIYVVDGPGQGVTQEIATIPMALGLGLLLMVIGVMLGVGYMLLLARRLPLGAAAKTWPWSKLPRKVLRHSFQVLLLVVLVAGVLLALFIPLSFAVALLALVAPGLTAVLAFLFGALVMVLLLYLYFVPVGLILDNLRLTNAIAQSFRLVRDNFWSTLGLILLSDLITLGFTVILARLVDFRPVGTVVAIVVNAFIGSGLAMGLMIFYRSRVLVAQGESLQVET
jgi:hypothetical protein